MRIILASLIAAVVVFIWSGISWMHLPWHNWDMKSFKEDGVAITTAIQKEAPESGLYMIPNYTPDAKMDNERQKTWEDKAKKGPFVYMSVKSDGAKWDMKMNLVVQFAIGFIVALLVAFLLYFSKATSYFGRVFFVTFAATTGALLTFLSNWNWWNYPDAATWVGIADVAIGWFIAGLFMAKIVKS